MCLYTSQEKPKTATKPIRCMKVVRRKGEDGYMPYFNRTNLINYRIGETVRIYPNEVSDFREPYCIRDEIGCYVNYTKKGGEFYKVIRGLHTYTYGNENVARLLGLKEKEGNEYLVLECEIPEGASYYEGHSNVIHSIYDIGFMTETSYCSDRLLVIREVPLSELVDIFGNETGGEKCV